MFTTNRLELHLKLCDTFVFDEMPAWRDALTLAPDEPLNRLYLADALLRFEPRRRQEALAMIESLIAKLSRPDLTLQDRRTLADARQILARAGG